MRAFSVVWRAVGSFYNELFVLAGASVLWWVTGGVAVAAAAVAGIVILEAGAEGWLVRCLVPLIAIPAGPASAALASMTRRVARDQSIDWSVYWEGWRSEWRRGLATSAASMAILSLLLVNWQFYRLNFPDSALLQTFSFLWLYLIVFWLGAQLYLYPVLTGLKAPSVLGTLRTVTILSFANPLFTILLLVLGAVLTGASIVFAILVVLGWPALMLLLGEHALLLLIKKVGTPSETGNKEGGKE